MDETDSRYAGQPMLRFLDSYVLDAIELLDEGTQRDLASLAPDLAAALETPPGTWQSIVEKALDLPPDAKAHIHQLWLSYLEQAEGGSTPADPIGFAHFVSDTQISAEPE